MKYVFFVSPVSGKMDREEKVKLLWPLRKYFGEIYGPNCATVDEFCNCVREKSKCADRAVVAGGDGTIFQFLNNSDLPMGYIPLGDGNSFAHALELGDDIFACADKIVNGVERSLDLVVCNGLKANFASVGVEGYVIHERTSKGFFGYGKALLKTLAYYRRHDSCVNGELIEDTLTTIVTKIPCYGYNLRVVPQAKIDDGLLHVLSLNPKNLQIPNGLIQCFFGGNRYGIHLETEKVVVECSHEQYLQMNGDVYAKGDRFEFEVLKNGMRVVC